MFAEYLHVLTIVGDIGHHICVLQDRYVSNLMYKRSSVK